MPGEGKQEIRRARGKGIILLMGMLPLIVIPRLLNVNQMICHLKLPPY